MKKLLLNRLQLDLNRLSNKEKKEIIGGQDVIGGNDDCLVLCWCKHLGEPEKIVPRSQCGNGSFPLCLMSADCV